MPKEQEGEEGAGGHSEENDKDLACSEGSVQSVVGIGCPRPSVPSTRGRYNLPQNILSPFQPSGGSSEESTVFETVIATSLGIH